MTATTAATATAPPGPRVRRVGRFAPPDPRSGVVLMVLLLLLAGAGVLAVGTGEFPLTPAEVVSTLLGGGDGPTRFIVITLRLPRVLCAILVGAALGVAGSIFGSVTRNPLGSPDVIGFTAGAATGAILAILLGAGGTLVVAAGAVVGGLATGAAVMALSWSGGLHGMRLVLIGIGTSTLLVSVNAYLLAEANITDAQRAAVWLTGSLNGRGWEHVWPMLGALVLLLPAVTLLARSLGMLELGDEAAGALGVRVEPVRIALLTVGIALAAVATASAGPIAFVALIAPQLARRLTRAPGPNLVASAVAGAVLLQVGDLLAQRAFAPTQLPVGIATGVIGGVYLAWLLAFGPRSTRA